MNFNAFFGGAHINGMSFTTDAADILNKVKQNQQLPNPLTFVNSVLIQHQEIKKAVELYDNCLVELSNLETNKILSLKELAFNALSTNETIWFQNNFVKINN